MLKEVEADNARCKIYLMPYHYKNTVSVCRHCESLKSAVVLYSESKQIVNIVTIIDIKFFVKHFLLILYIAI